MPIFPPSAFCFRGDEKLHSLIVNSLRTSPSQKLRQLAEQYPLATFVLASVMAHTKRDYAGEIRLVRNQAYLILDVPVQGVLPDRFMFMDSVPKDTFEVGDWVNLDLVVDDCPTSKSTKWYPRVITIGDFTMCSLKPAHLAVTAWFCATLGTKLHSPSVPAMAKLLVNELSVEQAAASLWEIAACLQAVQKQLSLEVLLMLEEADSLCPFRSDLVYH